MKKSRIDNSVIVWVKVTKCCITLKKMTCLGVLDSGDRDKNNGTSLKEGGGIEMSIYSAFPYT